MLMMVTISVVSSIVITILSQYLLGLVVFTFSMPFFLYVIAKGIGIWLTVYMVETLIYSVQLQKQLIHTEKINVVSELAASISHEVRNPMTVTKGFLQLLTRSDLSNEKRETYIKLSLAELERAEMIMNDYLSLTKSHKENIVINNLKEDFHYVINIIRPYSYIHNVEVIIEFNNKLNVRYDRNQFRQCLINIAKNGIEAMQESGKLYITLSSIKNKVIIMIKDTGLGMTKDQIERLGTPYYTTKEKGTGLGMSVVYSAIQSMHGKIHVESEKGQGTRFTITLPSYQQ